MEFLKRYFVEDTNTTSMNCYDSLSYFYDYTFEELSHTYYYKGKQVEQSVTGLVAKFVEPFDKEKWLPKKAKERGITPEELDAEWKLKANISASTGTLFHKYMEDHLAGKLIPPDYTTIPSLFRAEVQERVVKLIPHGNNFIKAILQDYVPVKSEFIVGLDTRIAGQIDQIFYNKKTGKFDIFDWKTNKAINCWNVWHKRMLENFHDLDDCELNSYSLQLSIYKYLLQHQGFYVDKLNLVWFNENNKSYQIMPCKDLSNRVENIL